MLQILSLAFAITYFQAGASLKIGLIHMHGVTEGWLEHSNFKKHIEQNTDISGVHLIDAYNYHNSLIPIWKQVNTIRETVKEIAANYDKIIAVGYSQGGVIWRGIIETWDDHNVDTFIALGSPLHGVYGAPGIAADVIPFLEWYSKTSIYWPIYNFGQIFGIFNYYLDPTHYSMYLEKSAFFPDINCERGDEETRLRYKRNFSKLRKLVMVGGPGDDVVDPWVSTQFGFYTDKGFHADPVTMQETTLYKTDAFGLRTLDERGGVVACTFNEINHLQFRDYKPMLDKCVVPEIEHVLKLYY